jgi:hypothetical protein
MKTNSYKLKNQFLIWLVHWGKLIDGLVGVVSFNLIKLNLAMKAASYLARWRWKCMRLK